MPKYAQYYILPKSDLKEIDKTNINNLLYAISSKFIAEDIYYDGLSIKSNYRETSYLSQLDSKQFLKERNEHLLSFICGAANIDIDVTQQKNTTFLFAVATTVEMMYFLRNLNLILPHCFVANLVQSFISGSKVVSTINGKIAPSGSYPSYKKWIKNVGSEHIECPPADLVTFYDNMGKYIVKDYRVLSSEKDSADIMTATLHFPLQGLNLQTSDELMPGNWRNKLSESTIQSKMREIRDSSKVNFRKYRLHFIENILSKVLSGNEDVQQKLDSMEANGRTCSNEFCGKTFTTRKLKCDSCGSKTDKKTTQQHQLLSSATKDQQILRKEYTFGANVETNHITLKMGEPVAVNPNSYKSVTTILDTVKEQLIDNNRKWVFLGCDGPPYCLSNRIIESQADKYNWITVVSGLDHLHMNQMKCLFKVLDPILLEPLGKDVLGFKSPKAYQYFVNAKDTHKAYQTLVVLLEGTASEMCSMYIKDNADSTISAQGFLEWCSYNCNETFNLIYQLIFNFALAIMVQKIGVRMNNHEVTDAGRMKFLPLFYAFNHPLYQEMEYRDLKNRAQYPASIKELLEQNCSFNTSTLPLNHQGGDFCLENKIKRHKLIAPKGRISNDTWFTISRGLDAIEKVYENGAKLLEIEEEDQYRDTDLYNEIVSWRAVLRSSCMLYGKAEENVTKNIYGEPLHTELDDITFKTEEKMEHYWSLAGAGTPLQNIRYQKLNKTHQNQDTELDTSDDNEEDF